MPATAIQLYINSKVHDTPQSTDSFAPYRTGTVSAGGTHQGKKRTVSGGLHWLNAMGVLGRSEH